MQTRSKNPSTSQPDSEAMRAHEHERERLAECLLKADPADKERPAGQGHEAACEAMALARMLVRPQDEARARAWQCSHLLRMGRHAELLAAAPEALALLEATALVPERCETLRVLALSASEAGAHDVALDAAHELVRISANLGDETAALNAAYGLAVCFERMGDSWQATRLLTQALADHGNGAPDLSRLIALNAQCAISIGLMHRLRGVESEATVQEVLVSARVAGEQALALLAHVPSPDYEVAISGNLAEVMLYQGEVAAAEPMLLRARDLARQRGLRAHVWRVQATLGSWLLASGRPADALASARALIAEGGAAMPPQTAIRAHDVAYRACRELQMFEQALVHFEAVERTERRRATTQLRAQSQLLVTRAETQRAQWQAEQSRLEALHHSERAAEFAESAERDPLTGLGNRRHFDRLSRELLPAAQQHHQALALAMIDIDHFKDVNDAHGHAVGDAVLVTLAQLLRENTRTGDVLARFGGEEFVVLLPDMPLHLAMQVCERLRERVANYPWALANAPALSVTISIGLTLAPPYEAAQLLERADAALYSAKRAGRNRIVLG